MVTVEPTGTVRLKLAVSWVPLTSSLRPPGVVWNVSTTVSGPPPPPAETVTVTVAKLESACRRWRCR